MRHTMNEFLGDLKIMNVRVFFLEVIASIVNDIVMSCSIYFI